MGAYFLPLFNLRQYYQAATYLHQKKIRDSKIVDISVKKLIQRFPAPRSPFLPDSWEGEGSLSWLQDVFQTSKRPKPGCGRFRYAERQFQYKLGQ